MRTLIVGLDAFDPAMFERLNGQGKLPHLSRYVNRSSYSRFTVSNPSQSEVSWTSIATGLNPGEHGLFDFVHRDPATYSLQVSLLPMQRGLGGTRFVPPFTATTIFDQAAAQGYPATSLWWPATFPARLESPVRSIPGLGTPDILGKLGVGTLFSTTTDTSTRVGKTPHEPLRSTGKGRFQGMLRGPGQEKRGNIQEATIEFELEQLDPQDSRLKLGKQALDLTLGEWSPIFEITFKLGALVSLRCVTRVILTQAQPDVRLYFLPLQIHPLHSPWHYGTPGNFVKETWAVQGPFLTLGWAQDTTGLEDGCITDDQFLALCQSIDHAREQILMHHLKSFREGVLGIVFDTLDRVQHMFWRDRPDVVEQWYINLDGLVSRIEAQANAAQAKEPARILILSDHGFARFERKASLNRWLQVHSYLDSVSGQDPGKFSDINWSQTQAYAIGLNSLYLNLQGREGKGIVSADSAQTLTNNLRTQLLDWRDTDGSRIVQNVWTRAEVFQGKVADRAPDLVVGYAPGYRASQDTGLGGWSVESVEPNRDHWGADHCIDPTSVPGVIFADDLSHFPNPTYRDIPALAIGAAPDPSRPPPAEPYTEQDQEIVEERLKSLGYL